MNVSKSIRHHNSWARYLLIYIPIAVVSAHGSKPSQVQYLHVLRAHPHEDMRTIQVARCLFFQAVRNGWYYAKRAMILTSPMESIPQESRPSCVVAVVDLVTILCWIFAH